MDDKHRFTVYTEEVIPGGHWVYLNDVLRMKNYLNRKINRLVKELEAIEKFGHGDGHGRGHTCANMAADALKENSDDKTT